VSLTFKIYHFHNIWDILDVFVKKIMLCEMQHFEVTFPFVIDPNFIEAKRHTSQFISRKGHKTPYLYKAFLFCFIQLFCFTSTCQFFHFQLSQNTSRPIKSYLPIELLRNSNLLFIFLCESEVICRWDRFITSDPWKQGYLKKSVLCEQLNGSKEKFPCI